MRVDLFDYDLPDAAIARRPTAARDGARMLVVDPRTDALEDRGVADLPDLVPEGALVVVNDTRVRRARLLGRKRDTAGRVELLLVRRIASSEGGAREVWEALGRASKPLREGTVVLVGEGDALSARVVARDAEAPGAARLQVEVTSRDGGPLEPLLEALGHVPLPPYVDREDDADDAERYQTVYARRAGAIAAPTAGLHLTDAAFARFEARRIAVARVTLHVGLGTFQPVAVDDLDRHPMHSEWYEVPAETAAAVAAARERGAPVVAVGTTVVRALESAADPSASGQVLAGQGETRLLIQPGHRFSAVDALMTNFHLPRSTLLALVSAFAGRERVARAYAQAIARGYRFYSYGDAMWIPSRATEAA